MAADRIEILRRVLSEWEAGDFRASAGLLAPDVVAVWGEPPGDDVVCRGRREVAERFSEFLATWNEFRVAAEQFLALDEDHVLVVALQSGKGKASGAKAEMRVHIVWRFAGEQVAGTYWFIERSRALNAAGLGSEPLPARRPPEVGISPGIASR